MIRSRETLAMILAAAIESERESPLTTPVCGQGKTGKGNPSIRQWSGTTARPATARSIAR